MPELSNRERSVYRWLANAFGPESAAIGIDGREPDLPGIAVFIWDPALSTEPVIFATIGMSKRGLPGQPFAAEFVFRVRGPLTIEDEQHVASFLANLSQHPFNHNLVIDWNHILRLGAVIPLFPACDGVALWSSAVGNADHMHDAEGEVRFLTVVPVTSSERDIARSGGTSALDDHWRREGLDPSARR